MEDSAAGPRPTSRRRNELIVVLFACAIYLGSLLSPPSLMDDVDAVRAQVARTMLESGDWVTARLNGVKYLEKPPLLYWMTAVSYSIFGVSDWAARIPLALSCVALCWLTYRFGRWAFGERTGFYCGLILTTSIGLWLFTRVQIPDAILTLTMTLAMWGFLRALDEEEPRPRLWAAVSAAAIGAGLLLKGLIAALFPLATALLYLAVTRRLTERETWRRLRPLSGALITLAIAAPWHVLATIRNPPFLDFTMRSEPGRYHGFFWFYFLNEHLFRFLDMRYPRDYNTVPRPLFWSYHLLWMFPWSAYLPGVLKLSYRPLDRAGSARLLALCWIGFLLAFFTLSTTQEYYSMPCYPAIAFLLASAYERGGAARRFGSRALAAVVASAGAALAAIFWAVRGVEADGDIYGALTLNPELYTLSLGHMADLTLKAFAYLRAPGVVTGLAIAVGLFALLRLRARKLAIGLALMMTLFLHAARLALTAFDPFLGSRPLAEAINRGPPGELIVDNQYYFFSSVFFYTNRRALLLNGRVNNLEYGSYAPEAPDVFIDEREFAALWREPRRFYLCVEAAEAERIERLVGRERIYRVVSSGGKLVLTNLPLLPGT